MAHTTPLRNEPPAPGALGGGEVLGGRFLLRARLGRGGFGEVWRASELLPDGSPVRDVALKLFSPGRSGAEWAHEAKVLASLRHPALVTVYSAGVLEGGEPTPFVAMELSEGRSLGDAIFARGPVPWRRALAFTRELAHALDAIHAAGIVHLDLKPANVLVGADGAVKLVDFGIARRWGHGPPRAPARPPTGAGDPLGTAALVAQHPGLADAGTAPPRAPSWPPSVVGTPGFMAPEVLEGREAAPAADAYALGVCLYTLLTARLPQRARPVPAGGADASEIEAWRAELRASTVAGDLAPLADLPAPPALVALAERLLALDPLLRPPPGALGRALDEAWRRPYGVPGQPYLGLTAYNERCEGFLFGRDDASARLAGELALRPMLVLQGASGSGKSSLAVAGVVPALARAFVDGCDDWQPLVVRPGHDLKGALARARQGRVGLVVVLDQLEELVTRHEPDALPRLADALAPCLGDGRSPQRGLRVLCTLREDFTTRVCSLPLLGPLWQEALRFVPPPSAASADEMVTAPAALAGVRVEGERVVVDDVTRELRSGEGRLPLVSFALSEWWATRQGGRLSADSWRAIGGVAGALSRHADAVLAALGPEARAAARDLFLRLVNPDGTRARVAEAALRERGPAHAAAIAAFSQARLLSTDESGALTLSHEALSSAWATLRAWLDDERVERAEAAALADAAALWRREAGEAKGDLLLRGLRLERARELAKGRPDLAPDFADLVDASARKARREALAKNALLAVALAALVGGPGLYLEIQGARDRDVKVRNDHLKELKAKYDDVVADRRRLAEEHERKLAELDATRGLARARTDDLKRLEAEHRAELFKRFAADSPEQKAAHFLQLWEHAWNLHDEARLVTFYAPQVRWFDFQGERADLARALAARWHKDPAERMLVGELSVTASPTGGGRLAVRMTRDERFEGRSTLAVINLVLRGEDGSDLQIESATVERVIAQGRPLGCPR
ncbi:MAG TPA: serine/threonine-protein kinase [Polyangiaceae bacterium]|nr:serine/threonine-protein kinase [Polyangiaceae bacterium]